MGHPPLAITARVASEMRSLTSLLLLGCASASRRLLLLHGSTSSSGAFLNHGAGAMLGAAAAAYHDSGPHAWQISGANWDDNLDVITDYGGWWLSTEQDSFDASTLSAGDGAIARVEEVLREGGFNGVMGFSTGGVVAAIVAARAALGEEGAATNLDFAVCINGVAPAAYEGLFRRLADSSTSLPTLHLLSKADALSERGEALAQSFGPTAVVQWHEAGHAMPPKKDCAGVIAWCDEQCPMGSKYR